MMLRGLGQIHDGEHHEDERLQRGNERSKNRPDDAKEHLNALQPQPPRVSKCRQPGKREQGDERENHFAGVDVAVEPQRQRDGSCNKGGDSMMKFIGISSVCNTFLVLNGCSVSCR